MMADDACQGELAARPQPAWGKAPIEHKHFKVQAMLPSMESARLQASNFIGLTYRVGELCVLKRFVASKRNDGNLMADVGVCESYGYVPHACRR
jgi:hypothetical protein